MIDAATVVWLVEGGAAPSDDARRALEAWAKARGEKLAPPSELGARATPIDWAAGDAVERGIARVRDALAGLDFEAAERELARAGAILRDHPELPQAAWLRAEVERAWSVRWLRGGDEERAKRAWQRAAGLDGGRAAGLGEKAFEPDAPITAVIRLVGVGAEGSTLRLDGAAIAPGEVKRSEGVHALAIVGPDGRTTWAEWVALAQGADVRIAAPQAPACSLADVRRARAEGGAIVAAGVRCGAWVAAVPDRATAGVVHVATCEASACGTLVEWRSIASVASGWTFGPVAPPVAESHGKWPAWATWTIAGVAVAGAAVGIAAAAGAFKSSPAAETQYVNGGITVHSF